MVRETYPNKNLGDFMSKHFVAVKVNAEKGEGVALAERFGVSGFPTLLVVDPENEELDRLVGFRKPDILMGELEPIIRGESFIGLKKRVAKAPEDYQAKLLLAKKHRERSQIDEAETLLKSVVGAEKAPSELRVEAEGALALVVFQKSEWQDAGPVRKYFDEHGGSGRATEQAFALYFYYANSDDTERLVPVAEYLLAHQRGRDAQFLNNYAWYLATHDARVDRALEIARRAQSISPDDANIIDTVAECYARRGNIDKAIEIEKIAIEYAAGRAKSQFEQRLKEFESRRVDEDDETEKTEESN